MGRKKVRNKKIKLKTNKSMAKRVKMTKTGKLLYSKAGRRHLLSNRSKKRKRQLKRKGVMSLSDAKGLRNAFPYGLR